MCCCFRHQAGYTQNSVYSTRTMYRNQTYPTFTSRTGPTGAAPPTPGPGEYDTGSLPRQASLPPQDGSLSSHSSQQSERDNYHNMYNISSSNTTHYNSADELKSPEEMKEYYDSFREDGYNQAYSPAKQAEWSEPYKRAGSTEPEPAGHYGSLDRNIPPLPHTQESDLEPTKFGSKRESHSDYKESVYHMEGMGDPRMHPVSGGGYETSTGHYIPPAQGQQTAGYLPGTPAAPHGHSTPEHQPGYPPPPPHPAPHGTPSHGSQSQVSQSTSSLPYIDSSSSQSSIHSAASHHWNDPRDFAKGRFNSHTPIMNNVESPPIRSAPSSVSWQGGRVPQQDTGPSGEPDGGGEYQPPQNNMTITKFQSYVEVSKPFEMSDFYKYSEKLRKQRVSDTGVPTASNPGTPAGTPQTPTSHGAWTPGGYAPGREPSPCSQQSSRSRPSSPYSHCSDGSHPTQPTTPSSPLPNHPNWTPRTQYSGVQSNLVQTSSYHGGSGTATPPPHQSPRHMAYQPPKPQTCDAVDESLEDSSTPRTPQRLV